MTEPNKPTPETQYSPAAPESKKTHPKPDATGFFNRVRQELNPQEAIHPSEKAEIVVMDEE